MTVTTAPRYSSGQRDSSRNGGKDHAFSCLPSPGNVRSSMLIYEGRGGERFWLFLDLIMWRNYKKSIVLDRLSFSIKCTLQCKKNVFCSYSLVDLAFELLISTDSVITTTSYIKPSFVSCEGEFLTSALFWQLSLPFRCGNLAKGVICMLGVNAVLRHALRLFFEHKCRCLLRIAKCITA